MTKIELLILVLGIIFSLFYGFAAFDIFEVTKPTKKVQKIHQTWFNFIGSFLGWLLVLEIYKTYPLEHKVVSFFLVIFAFIGVTGHLPAFVMNIILGTYEFIKKALGLINK